MTIFDFSIQRKILYLDQCNSQGFKTTRTQNHPNLSKSLKNHPNQFGWFGWFPPELIYTVLNKLFSLRGNLSLLISRLQSCDFDVGMSTGSSRA